MDWNARWEEGDTPWEKGYAAPPLMELLEGPLGIVFRDAKVLVPGCGSGHDVRALARYGACPVGMDLSEAALDVARNYPVVGDEKYLLGNFLNWDESCYEGIWEHTCFCAIQPEERAAYARAAARLIQPGGYLAGVFFLNPWDPGEEGNGPPFGATREEILETFTPWFDLRFEKIPEKSYPGREGKEWLILLERKNAKSESCDS